MRNRHDRRDGLTDRDIHQLRQIAAVSITPGVEDLARLAGLTRPDPNPTTAPTTRPNRRRGRR